MNRFIRMICISCISALTFGAAGKSFAASDKKCLESPRLKDLLKIYDLNEDGCIDQGEQDLIKRDAGILPAEPPPPKVAKREPYRPAPVLLVRDAHPANAFLDGGSKVSDAGALFSYTSDNATSTSTWAAKGSVVTGFVWDREAKLDEIKNGYVSRIAFLTGIEFDRTFQTKTASDSGSTSAKAGFEIERFGGVDSELLRQYFKADMVYTTDFDGKASVYGFQSYWQPMLRNGPIGKTTQIADKVWFGFRPTLAADYFHVSDNGTFKALAAGEDYLWLGTKIAASLSFDYEYLKSLTLAAKYFYMAETLRAPLHRDINYVQVSALYDLVKDMLSLEARYTYGNTPRTLARQNEFYAGLTVKLGDLPASPTSN